MVVVALSCSRDVSPQQTPGGAASTGQREGATVTSEAEHASRLAANADSDSREGAEAQPQPGPLALRAEDELVALEVEGHGDAVVWLPVGATSPRPVMVATHGNYDTPESTCLIWGRIIRDRGFVLCLRGVPRADSPSPNDLVYHYKTPQAVTKELDAALAALAARFSAYVDAEALIYSGFSQGAYIGRHIVLADPARFPRTVLIEGAFEPWNSARCRTYAAGGGERLLFACGQWGCKRQSDRAARCLEQAGVASRVVFAEGAGHTYGGTVAQKIADAFDWIVAGDARWAERL